VSQERFMPKLTLRFGDRVIHEYGLQSEVTIGRLPDNTIVIDNPAVSSHHARVVADGDDLVIEDLRSKNGTYVNDQHVVRAVLKNRDVVLIGKHQLVFDDSDEAGEHTPQPAVPPTMGATAYLDTKQHRAMLARLREARAARERTPSTPAPTTAAAAASAPATDAERSGPNQPGVLRVLSGAADATEYTLEAKSSVIGKSHIALIRLRGWFKPQIAATIVREGESYFLAPSAGDTLVNGEPLHCKRELKDGDVLDISGLIGEFRRPRSGVADPRSQTNVA
jgi:pSer/pThr/pTyr-binding forkhead associated (FHA) protein